MKTLLEGFFTSLRNPSETSRSREKKPFTYRTHNTKEMLESIFSLTCTLNETLEDIRLTPEKDIDKVFERRYHILRYYAK